MTVLLLDGFELDRTSTSFLRRYPGSVNIATNLPNQTGRLGGKALRIENNIVINADIPNNESSNLMIGLGIRISSLVVGSQFSIFDIYTTGSILAAQVFIKRVSGDNGFKIKVTRAAAAGMVTELDLSYALDFNIWWHLEFQIPLTQDKMGLIFKINDDIEVETDIDDVTAVSGYERFESNFQPAGGGYIDIDDLCVSDGASGFMSSDLQVTAIIPNEDQSVAWSPNTIDNYEAIDDGGDGEVDDDITFLTGSVTGQQDIYGFSALRDISGKIESVYIATDARSDATADAQLEQILEGVVFESQTVPGGGLYGRISKLSSSTHRLEDMQQAVGGIKIPGDPTGSGNLILPVTLFDGSVEEIFLNEDDSLEVTMANGSIEEIDSVAEELPVTLSNDVVNEIPLSTDGADVAIGFYMFDGSASWPGLDHLGAADPKYYKGHVVQGTTLNVTLTLDHPAKVGTTLVYNVSGDATPGTHYNITAGTSPIAVSEGAETVTISLEFPTGVKYFPEKNIILTLDAASTKLAFTDVNDEFRVNVRSSVDPPTISFVSPVSSSGIGLHTISVSIPAGVTEEITTIYWRAAAGSTAVEGVDYNFLAEPGNRSITVGQTNSTIPVDVLTNAGKILKLQFHHEPFDGSERNQFGHTLDFSLEQATSDPTQTWAGEPTDWVSSGGQPGSITPLTHIVDSVKTHPTLGTPLEGYKNSIGVTSGGYYRKSFENQYRCSGPLVLFPLKAYTLYATKVELSSDYDNPRYFKINVRDRGSNLYTSEVVHDDTDHEVLFDREHPSPLLVTDTGSWGVDSTSDWFGTNSDYGVEEVTLRNGKKETWLWVVYHEENPDYLDDGTTVLCRPVFFKGSVSGHENEGVLVYDPYVRTSSSLLTGPPDTLWPSPNDFWEPRGYGVCDPTNIHTLTLS